MQEANCVHNSFLLPLCTLCPLCTQNTQKKPTDIAGGSSPAAIKAYHTSGAFQRMYGPPLATYFLLPVNGSSKFSVN